MPVKVKFIAQMVKFASLGGHTYKEHGIAGLPGDKVFDQLEFEYANLDRAILAFRDFYQASKPKAEKLLIPPYNGFHCYCRFIGDRKPRGFDKSEMKEYKQHNFDA